MKRAVGSIAVLVLLATLAVAQPSQVPSFPADANPSLANNTNVEMSSDLPPAMAANQASMSAIAVPSFPTDARPMLANNTIAEMSNSVMDGSYQGHRQVPSFPADANPSK